MINFSVGPVQISEDIRLLGSEQVPYFRTSEFSEMMLESESLLLDAAGAPAGSRAVFLTGSGTAAMEAAVVNLLGRDDKALVINGGAFGARFARLCEIHGVEHETISLPWGVPLKEGDLAPYEDSGCTALLVNLHETSTGVLYDLDLLHSFCERNGLFLVVDAISAFLADPVDMGAKGIGAMIVGSQKALAVPPGVSMVVLSPEALERVERFDSGCMYLDLAAALKDGERGQTPFTPAVGVLIQLNQRLRQVSAFGVDAEISRVARQAADFRRRLEGLPLSVFSQAPSNAVTSLEVAPGVSPSDVFALLKDRYGIWVCPNGGELGKRIFRVGHIGDLTPADNDELERALRDLAVRGLLG